MEQFVVHVARRLPRGGSCVGIKSNVTKGQADPVNYSFDVKVEGQNVVRKSDPMMQNKKNTI
ncbi:MAG: PAAR-like domain-containing protein [Polyangia bacterium]